MAWWWWWIACSAEPPCEEVAVDACADRDDCVVVEASPVEWLDNGTSCYEVEPPVAVGCQEVDQGCDDVLVYAQDADGLCHEFGDSCVPAGFTACEEDPSGAEPCR